MKNTSFFLKSINRLLKHSLFAIIICLSINVSIAQSPWQVTLRPGANFPVKKLGTIDLKTGVGIEGSVGYRFLPNLSALAGWGWNHFKPEQSANDIDIEETGYLLGIRYDHPLASSKLKYALSGGAVYNHIEVENNEGNIIDDSGHGWGWQIEGGLSYMVSKRFAFEPNIRYRSLSRKINLGEQRQAVDLRYISAGVNLTWQF